MDENTKAGPEQKIGPSVPSTDLLACVELAILANGGFAYHKEWCECDPDVGACPCRYCAIHACLDKTFRWLKGKQDNEKVSEAGGRKG